MALSFESDADTLSKEFQHRITSRRERESPRVVGVEHEYVVRRAGTQIDFSGLIGTLAVRGRALHPTNRHAYLLETGAVIMADGKVAEIATPPVRAGPGAATSVDAWATTTEGELTSLLGPEYSVRGGSTHISVRVDNDLADRVAVIYARSLAAPMMLMMDRVDSPGLLVRPRPGRHEICGEFVTGASLRAAVGFALASTAALERALRESGPLPKLLDVVLEPGRRRYGWYVDRRAFGADLYRDGRNARLRLAGGGWTTAGDYLRAAWRFAEPEARRLLSSEEFQLVDDVATGRKPIPIEGGLPDDPAGAHAELTRTSHGIGLARRHRGELTVQPVSATWDWMAFELRSNGDRAVALLPRSDLGYFLQQFDDGQLDELLIRYLHEATGERALRVHAQTAQPGLHDSISPGPSLLPGDRFGIGAGPASQSRPGKRLPPEPEPTPAPGTKGNSAAALAILGAVLMLIALSLGAGIRSGTSHAAAPADVDPRVSISEIEAVVDRSGEVWVRIQFAEPWADTPPRDLFSVYFAMAVSVADQVAQFGWGRHDGDENPIFEAQDWQPGSMVILGDGSVLIATGLISDGNSVDFLYQSGSWVDENETDAVFADGEDSIDGSDLILADPATIFGAPTFDLITGLPIESVAPTTTTTATTTSTTLPASVAPSTTATPSTTTLPASVTPSTTATPSTTTLPASVTPSTTATPTLVPPASTTGDSGRQWLWLIPILFGLLLIGGGWYVLGTSMTSVTAPPTTPTYIDTTPMIWFEKGNSDPPARVLR